MDDEFEGTGWSQAEEDAFQAKWRLRAAECPRMACRRARQCMHVRRMEECPGVIKYPFSEEETHKRVKMVCILIARQAAATEARGIEEARRPKRQSRSGGGEPPAQETDRSRQTPRRGPSPGLQPRPKAALPGG